MRSKKVTVVIAAHNNAAVIEPCLNALHEQVKTHSGEIIVADSSTDGTRHVIEKLFPQVEVLKFKPSFNIPQLRSEAIRKAKGEIVAIIDPYSIVADNWLYELLKAHKQHANLVIGGGVELFSLETQGIASWATYLHEYGGFLSPLEEKEVTTLPGCNISYKHIAMSEINNIELDQRGFWKAFVNWHLEGNSHKLWLDPSVMVSLMKPIPFSDFFRTRFHHGRCFAGMRSTGARFHQRLVRALTTPLLPALFLWRMFVGFWPKNCYRQKFLLSIPLMLLLNFSWAWGELWGYLLGCGRSCGQLFY